MIKYPDTAPLPWDGRHALPSSAISAYCGWGWLSIVKNEFGMFVDCWQPKAVWTKVRNE